MGLGGLAGQIIRQMPAGQLPQGGNMWTQAARQMPQLQHGGTAGGPFFTTAAIAGQMPHQQSGGNGLFSGFRRAVPPTMSRQANMVRALRGF